MTKLSTCVFTSCLFILFVCLPLHAQTATATLTGTVEDQNRAALPGASIIIKNYGTALERTAVTNDSGGFTVPLLPPGTYSLVVRREGFTSVEVRDIVLNVGDQKAIQIGLKVGDVNAAIEVRPDETLVNTSPAVATTIDRTFVQNLPLNGRSFSSLVLLTPGVTVSASSGTDFGQFSVNGQRASTNYFTVDGVSANIGIGSGTIGGAQNLALSGAYPATSALGGTNNLVSIDALEEFKIQTSSYTAESGRQPGGQVQLITRSGSNNFHGTLFEYFRNEALDARNYFNKEPAPEPALRQNQFGGTFSGPLPFFNFGEGGPFFTAGKDRTFFFFSYEGQRLRLPSSGVVEVPSLRLRQIAAPALRPILNAFPIPTGSETLYDDDGDPGTPNVPSGFAPFNYGISDPNNLDATSLRIDHSIGPKLTLFGRFNESPSDSVIGVLTPFRSVSNTRTLTLGSAWILSPQLTNELRFNYSRQHGKSDNVMTSIGGAVPFDPNLLTSGLGGNGNLFFAIGGFAAIAGGAFVDSFQKQLNIVDNVSLTRGSHQIKFGIDFRRLSPIYGTQDQQNGGFISESAIESGTLDFVTVATIQPSRPQFDNFSAYIQDTWKVSPRLTLDLGLRWEVNPAPTEADGKMPPAVIGVVGTDVTNATLGPQGTQFYKTFWTAFAPRFGAAYQVRTKPGQETVLRGGFGVYYDLGSGAAANGWPFQASKNLPNAECPVATFPLSPVCAARPGIVLVTTLPTSISVIGINENLKLPYSLHWNLAVEQSLGTKHALSVAYVASAARRLLTTQSLNGNPRNPITGDLLPRPNPNFRNIGYTLNGPTADYHSMQTQYRTRFRSVLQALVNYTWSHAIDQVSTDIGIAILERGNANFDVRHNFSAALHYDIPTLKAGRLTEGILRDWSIDTIIHAQSGLPIDIGGFQGRSWVMSDGVSGSLRPDLILGVPIYLNDSNVPGGRRFNPAAFRRSPGPPSFPNRVIRQGTFGRNVLRGLPLYQVDVALGRTFQFTEKLKLQLKAEAFNLFNHPMFGSYGRDFTVPARFGVPQTTMNSSLGGLSSLYQLGGPRSIQFSGRLSF